MLAAALLWTAESRVTKQSPVTDAPKQSPYAIFIEVCGKLQYVLVTTDPYMGANRAEDATPKMLEALRSVPKERVIRLKHRAPYCPTST